jgi:hypothetical protein
MMARTQITLSPELQKQARRRAGELGISLAQYLRELVAADLGARKPKADRSAVFALGESGGSDISVDKDRMLGEAVSARKAPAASASPKRARR